MRGPGYDARPIYVGFVVNNLAVVQVFPRTGYLVYLLSVLSRDKTFLSAPKGPDGLWGLRTPHPPFHGSPHLK